MGFRELLERKRELLERTRELEEQWEAANPQEHADRLRSARARAVDRETALARVRQAVVACEGLVGEVTQCREELQLLKIRLRAAEQEADDAEAALADSRRRLRAMGGEEGDGGAGLVLVRITKGDSPLGIALREGAGGLVVRRLREGERRPARGGRPGR